MILLWSRTLRRQRVLSPGSWFWGGQNPPKQATLQLTCGEKASQVVGTACTGHGGRRWPGVSGKYHDLWVGTGQVP